MQIIAKGLKFSYNKDAKFRRDALNGVDLVISDGDFFWIIGETGSGKSTFIQHLNGLIAVQEGSLTVGDFDLSSGVKKDKKAVITNIIKFVLGVAGIVIGAQLLVDNSQIVAKAIGISDGLIAITVVAIGTSLPELITTITSIVKKQGELGVGNIIGANIIDLVLILPICSFISKGNLEVAKQCAYIDLPALLVISSVAVIPTLINKKFTKVQGIILLILYIAYIVLAYLGQQGKLFY